MISVVVYGRNDSHGYNLHKRAALGLNCTAELLSDPDDEILFVDYNTPDDYPTFPEAIADTLTPRAVARLRILRVRPSVHARFSARTHLQALEPIARNVAVRRSNPQNRWILSTNTDMIFVMRRRASLSEVAADLGPGFYHLPRFELPESLWEGFDRRNPACVIEEVRTFGRAMFLNEIVYGAAFIKYDAPGDFQLMQRDDLFAIHGFDERMLLGWHVDSNIARRLHLRYGRVDDLAGDVFGYHCDHTRQVTPAHRHRAPSNDPRAFVDEVAHPELPLQAATWGCADDDIEELRLSDGAHQVYVRALAATLTGEMDEPAEVRHVPATFDAVDYDPRHVLPFLADVCASAPRHSSVGWVGGRDDTFRLFSSAWAHAGFTGPLMVLDWCAPLVWRSVAEQVRVVEFDALASADLFIVEFSAGRGSRPDHRKSVAHQRLDDAVDRLLRRTFAQLVSAERDRQRGGLPPRKFVGVNAIHTGYEMLVLEEVAAAATPFATRLRHGFVKPRSAIYGERSGGSGAEAPSLLDAVEVGDGGERVDSGIRAPFGRRGVLLQGPHRAVPAGVYRLELTVEARGLRSLASVARPIIVDVLTGATRLIRRRIRVFGKVHASVTFQLSDEAARAPLYCRIFRGRSVELVLTGLRLTRTGTYGVDRHDPLVQLVKELANVSRETVSP
jgi:hypothetical protein